ncbi:MAG: type II toxin-antitoxin system Phd/YefM family antitoxin [Candidatus Brachytrichaceae bacterium NZ_4S206]|jgi:prevent-host-death family protein
MAVTEVSVADAKRRLSELISRASAGERFVIRRRDKPVAALIGADDLARLEGRKQAAIRLGHAFGQREAILRKIAAGELHPIMAAYGLWADQPEWDDLVAETYKQRRRKHKRPAVSL